MMRNPLTPCKACREQVAETARSCPHCGAPGPGQEWPWSFGETLIGSFFALSLAYVVFWALFSALRRSLGIP
ncbi:hypothetical protein [Neomegalonema sp.]|uniref:hypothetical protein n=1 Tax=Neomegalonema sp. TaxID=2039713 RepID=UPI0026325D17|nr:hypothetical protein [Neomegalonema sp.]MDD2869018.1 hypothetical protein [Neomegalonema sp.]